MLGAADLEVEGAGVAYSAASVVSDSAEMIDGIIIDYVDTAGMDLIIAGQTITPGFQVCGVYRIAETCVR